MTASRVMIENLYRTLATLKRAGVGLVLPQVTWGYIMSPIPAHLRLAVLFALLTSVGVLAVAIPGESIRGDEAATGLLGRGSVAVRSRRRPNRYLPGRYTPETRSQKLVPIEVDTRQVVGALELEAQGDEMYTLRHHALIRRC